MFYRNLLKPLTFLIACTPAISSCEDAGTQSENKSPDVSMNSARTSAPGNFTYRKTIPVFWNELYANGGETLYCGNKFDGSYNKKTNIEHVYPMSWVTKTLQCGDRESCRRHNARFNEIESDMHNMYPALVEINEERSSMPFGLINGEHKKLTNCDVEIDYKARKIEPRESIRGEIARAMLYMSETYNLEIFTRQKEMLTQWHRQDPPDNFEKQRNQRIEKLQGRSNPYIAQ